MSNGRARKIPLLELLISLMPITLMGKAMLVGLIIWFIDWAFVDQETLFGSYWLRKLFDLASLLAFIPFIYLLIKGARWVTQHLLWRLRRRLIVTYLLIGALPLLLLTSLVVLIGYVVVWQSSVNLVSRQLDGYLEQSRAAALSLSDDLKNWDPARLDEDQVRRRLQERANALAPIFPDLTLSLSTEGGNRRTITVKGPLAEEGGAPAQAIDDLTGITTQLPSWMQNRSDFHGLVFEDGPNRQRRVHVRHLVRLSDPAPITFLLDYAVAENMCKHLRHITDLEVKPGQVLTPLVLTPAGGRLDETIVNQTAVRDSNRPASSAGWPPGNWPIFKTTTNWSTGKKMESDVLLLDLSFLKPMRIWGRLQQFKSGSAIGNILIWAIAGLGIFFLLIALVAITSAGILTSSITGAVHYLYTGTKLVEIGDFDHEIPITGRDQLGELSMSFNQMTRSIRELLRVSAEKQRLDQEMKIAAQVQSQLFPRSTPKTDRLDFAPGVCIPARSVSGDYYDFIDVAPEIIGIVIADVCGKGVSAALMMANLQAILRGQVQAYHDAYSFKLRLAAPSDSRAKSEFTEGAGTQGRTNQAELSSRSSQVQRIVSQVNQQVVNSVLDASYITFFYAEFEEQGSILRYTNAGHNPPLLLRPHDQSGLTVERLDRGGTVLGLFPDCVFEESEIRLESGDLLVAFTDGLVEACNPANEEYGEENLIQTLLKCAHLRAAEIENEILHSVKAWTHGAEQEDDLTIVIFKVN